MELTARINVEGVADKSRFDSLKTGKAQYDAISNVYSYSIDANINTQRR